MKSIILAAAIVLFSVPAFAKTETASWYGQHWAGRHTANGERFNPRAFTAASKTLPMGTKLLISRGHRHVIVRINDRGPYVRGRGLDLSQAAASKLNMIHHGVAKVQYTVLKPKKHH